MRFSWKPILLVFLFFLFFYFSFTSRPKLPIFSSGRSMAVHFYTIAREDISMPMAFALYKNIDPLTYRKALNNKVILADGREFVLFGKYRSVSVVHARFLL